MVFDQVVNRPKSNSLYYFTGGLSAVYDIQNRTMTRTTFRGVNQTPVWTPDGRHIAFSSSQDVTRPALYWIDPEGGGNPEILSRDGEVQFPASWSPDGKALAYAEIKAVEPETDLDIWQLTGGGPWMRQRLLGTPFSDSQPMFSPDGRALAWLSKQWFAVSRWRARIQRWNRR